MQFSLLNEDHNLLSISEAAIAMNVSEASVRNWIKTGYLQATDRNYIFRTSLESFCEKVVGSEKLTARANKSHFDSHDHASLKSSIDELISSPAHNGESLSSLYESSLSQSHRNIEGVYYTPSDICDLFFHHLPSDRSNFIFLDPCCGSGNFLVAAIKAGLRPENVFGCDIDATALAIARKRVHELTGCHSVSLFHADFLDLPRELQSRIPKADIIFTNPPWGKKLENSKREKLAGMLSCKKSLDTSGLFLLACQPSIHEGGYYGMLLPESFFNVAAFELPRKRLLEDNLIAVVDHGKAFDGLLTRAISFVAKKEKPKADTLVRCVTSCGEAEREQASFYRNPSMIVNFSTNGTEAAVIDYLYALPHNTLAGRARWALGVVTGNNKRHLIDSPSEGFVPVYRGSDIEKDALRAPCKFISKDMSGFQQVAAMEMYNAPEKLIYRFISSRLVFYHDTEQSMILNSANLVIPDTSFPVSMKILASYLSCDFINWFYSKIFATHKVLRSDIERIPIFVDQLKDMETFDEAKLLQRIGIEGVKGGSYRIKK